MTHLTKYSFGATSATVTSLAFIVSLSTSPEPRLSIIGSLFVLAVADNITDSLGIHIFQESDLKSQNVVNTSTLSNFLTRLLLSLSFMSITYLMPMQAAVITSVAWGVSILVVLSYLIAVEQGFDPKKAIMQHLAVAVIVILSSLILRQWIGSLFN